MLHLYDNRRTRPNARGRAARAQDVPTTRALSVRVFHPSVADSALLAAVGRMPHERIVPEERSTSTPPVDAAGMKVRHEQQPPQNRRSSDLCTCITTAVCVCVSVCLCVCVSVCLCVCGCAWSPTRTLSATNMVWCEVPKRIDGVARRFKTLLHAPRLSCRNNTPFLR